VEIFERLPERADVYLYTPRCYLTGLMKLADTCYEPASERFVLAAGCL
jgi:hypothetical protein